jgi:hypothetical protein
MFIVVANMRVPEGLLRLARRLPGPLHGLGEARRASTPIKVGIPLFTGTHGLEASECSRVAGAEDFTRASDLA